MAAEKDVMPEAYSKEDLDLLREFGWTGDTIGEIPGPIRTWDGHVIGAP